MFSSSWRGMRPSFQMQKEAGADNSTCRTIYHWYRFKDIMLIIDLIYISLVWVARPRGAKKWQRVPEEKLAPSPS